MGNLLSVAGLIPAQGASRFVGAERQEIAVLLEDVPSP